MTTGAAFLASAVEAVEALTVVLAVGVTRGWRSSLIGAGTATCTLAAVIAALGPALSLMPLGIFVFLTLVSLGLVAVLRRMSARQALIAANAAGMGA